MARRLRDAGAQRLADMDDQGVDVQVPSLTNPGVQNLPPKDAVIPVRPVHEAYYKGIDPQVDFMFATFGVGW
jgi:hypothetical protein